ncbi:protein charlatan isoform X2 [Drosophila bipectinata]|uniref:protein charlatan isoform X2 n=1 Tax=Drosophila bipectinata TaxID=42026 RepID=UPI001C8A924C|nr:protein charlatan isoform X2 [Drosophila bipectinata]
MATLIPTTGGHPAASGQTSNVEATYEDMFKEITRKLYGEETGNGLHTLGTPVAQVATSGPTAVPEGEQRSFTNLQQLDRSTAPSIEYESSAAAGGGGGNVATTQANVIQQQQQQQQQAESGNSVVVTASGGSAVVPAPTVAAVGGFKSEDHLSTAFGLAALMQNGFAAGQAGLLKAGEQQQRWAQDGSGLVAAAAAEPQLVQWTSGGKLQSYAHVSQQQQQQQQPHQSTPKSKKHRQEHAAELIYASPSTSANAAQNLAQSTPTSAPSNSSGGSTSSSGGGGGGRKKAQAQAAAAAANGVHIQKRYACTHCPYSTDRRDLYTRHENIHKDEKPFQCYACLKQFNRADHVKKHFLRMHRELQYDINKTRRHVSAGSGSSGSGSSGGGSHHSGGRGNVTINATGVNIDNAFLEAQRHPTSSSLSIVETIEAVASAADMPLAQLKQEKLDDGGGGVLPLHVMQQPVASSSSGSSGSHANGNGGGNSGLLKPKREKRFTCCYCPWSGADKWGLKRHLNTHTKPFVCLLCDYKAARSERLATHVLKVHNKRACSKCSYLADTQEEFQAHMSDVHPHDNRPARSGNGNTSGGSSSGNSSGNGTGGNANAGGHGHSHSHSQNLNVLRTIGNSLVANNQLNTYAGNAFGGNVGNANGGGGGGAVTIYTTTTNEGVTGSGGGGGGNGGGGVSGNISGGGPLQEIIVNPSSMVGWRLSANGSLIPPHDLLTGGLPNAATQKRGSERLFQYLEAEGSDPEDYARLLKMDAISRNTASVAQDFHKAGGVHELKIPANHQLLFNNKLPSQWTTREAAALLYSLSSMGGTTGSGSLSGSQRQKFGMRARQHSTGEDDENTPSSASSSSFSGDEFNMSSTSPLKLSSSSRHAVKLEKMEDAPTKAMMATAFLEAASYEQTAIELLASKRKIKVEDPNDEDQENQQQHQPHQLQQQQHQQQQQRLQLIKSSPAYKLNNNNNSNNNNNNNYYKDKSSHRNAIHHHRQDDKENSKSKSAAAAAAAVAADIAAAAAAAASGNSTSNQTPFLTQMEYQNLNRIGTQFQNYVKDIINKYYAAETPLMLAAAAAALPTATTTGQQQQQQQLDAAIENLSPSKRRRLLSETEEYIEYLRNKEDITLTIAPKAQQPSPPQTSLLKRQLDLSVPRRSPKKAAPAHNNGSSSASRKGLNQLATLLPLLADAASKQEYLAAPLDFSKKSEEARSSRKQAQPKKIRLTPDLVVAMLRDKYLNRMVRQRLGCLKCNQSRKSSAISFNYHTLGSLALHRYWRHRREVSATKRRTQLQAALLKRSRRLAETGAEVEAV